ncbi:MAG: tyrosine-type recombinase/integrase [Acidobacteria bacterium]|nr:tyrosine-type recombinase/integrase [Acidobacteriota bacterium]
MLGQQIGLLDGLVRAKAPTRLPVVLTWEEVKAVLELLEDTPKLVTTLLYGAGLRLLEGLEPRVKDVDFTANQIVVQRGKGENDRVTMLPQAVKEPLARHLERVRAQHQRDLQNGHGRVVLPGALVIGAPPKPALKAES